MTKAQRVRLAAVGLGRCGGRLAAAAASLGWPAIAIDTSRADLRSLPGLPDERRLYVGIDDVEGTGGAADLGAECLRAKRGEIRAALDAALDAAPDAQGYPDLLVLAGGLGGGTGANLPLLAELLLAEPARAAKTQRADPERAAETERAEPTRAAKTQRADPARGEPSSDPVNPAHPAHPTPEILALGVLPASSEPHGAKVNALRAVNALVDAPVAARALVDNQRVLAAYADVSLADYERQANAAALAALDGLGQVLASEAAAALRSLEPAQWLACLRAGGLSVAGGCPVQPPLSADALLAAVRETLAAPAVFAGGYDLADVGALGLILALDTETLASTPARVLVELSERLRTDAGATGGDVFVGLYETKATESWLHVAAGGLPLPARPRELLAETAAEAERLAERLAERRRAGAGMEKLDLAALEAHLRSGPLAAPSTSGKGMVKARPPASSDPGDAHEE